jgi:hypothetical protein
MIDSRQRDTDVLWRAPELARYFDGGPLNMVQSILALLERVDELDYQLADLTAALNGHDNSKAAS